MTHKTQQYRAVAEVVPNFIPGTMEPNKARLPMVMASNPMPYHESEALLESWRKLVTSPDWSFRIELVEQ
jgi:hypothetical protein